MPNQAALDQFGQFCVLKKQVGGPDVHMKAAGAGTEDAGEERPWRLAVYNNFCSTPTAAVIWATWSLDEIWNLELEDIEKFVKENWAGLPIRQNRRPARSVPKLARSLYTLSEWMEKSYPFLEGMNYEEAWSSLDSVYTWGRYVKIKFLETARCYLGFDQLIAPNIRSAGGWSPRKALGILYPELASVIANKARNDRTTLFLVHGVADEVRHFVTENYVPVSNYELEALLCNYRQTLSLRKAFYVGRTIDSELEYDAKIRAYWGAYPYQDKFNFFATRQKVFPVHCLGEVMGWDGVRKDLSPLLTENGILWSDVVFDYNSSKNDLSHPVRW